MNTFSPQFSPNVLLTIGSWEDGMEYMGVEVNLQHMMEHGHISSEGYRRCPKCETWKLKSEYYPNKTRSNKVSVWCKICHNKKNITHQRNNKSLYRMYGRRHDAKKAGIIVEDIDTWYDEQLAKQDGKCAMPDCRLPAEKNNHGRLCIDHDHAIGKFRALLCNRCNSFLGHYEKRKLVMEAYLRQEE